MQELVPPTVPVPLTALTGDADLGVRQVAGPGGAEALVHAVHTSEMADPVPYLLGGELLLSAGVHCPAEEGAEADAHWQRYVARSVEAGAAALGFGIAPVHERVPPALAAACDEHGLPLLEVDRDTPFTAVARAVWQAMADSRHRALRRLSEAQQTLAAAAARPHPVPAVLAQLAQRLGAWAVLLGPDGTRLAEAGSPPPAPVRAELASLTGQLRRGPSSAASSHGELRLSVYGLGARERYALGLCAGHRDGIDGAIATVAVVLLTLLTERGAAGTEEQRSAALVRLMLGGGAADAAPLLGGGAERWSVVHGRRRAPGGSESGHAGGDGSGDEYGEEGLESGPFTVAALAAGLGTPLIDLSDGRLRALVPVKDGGQARSARDGGPPEAPDAGRDTSGDTSGDTSRAADRARGSAGSAGGPLHAAAGEGAGDVAGDQVRAQPGWTLGVGPPVPADELERGDAEAARALRRALAERRPLVRQFTADGLPPLASLVEPGEARALAGARLGPLRAHPALLETLRVWLSLHGSWDRSAVALEVHRNTVRQRIARTGTLLGVDLAEQDVRMELWFALKWL